MPLALVLFAQQPVDENDPAYLLGKMIGGLICVGGIVGIVVFVQWALNPSKRKRAAAAGGSEAVAADVSAPGEGELALQAYRKGMKNLGRSLVVLAVFQLLVGALLVVVRFDLIVLGIVGVMAVIHLGLGVLALMQHGWVNYAVAAWSMLLLAGNVAALGKEPGQQQPGSQPGNLLGLLIGCALLYYAIGNLRARSKARGLSALP